MSITCATYKTTWDRPVFAAAGLVSLARGVIALYKPDYWNPSEPIDYAAVVGTSLTFLLLGVALWGFILRHPRQDGKAGVIFHGAVISASISAVVMSLSNFLDDMILLRWLGWVWVAGILVLTASLFVAGFSAFGVRALPRHVGVLLLISAAGLLFVATFGFFLLGLALLVFGVLKIKG